MSDETKESNEALKDEVAALRVELDFKRVADAGPDGSTNLDGMEEES